jgi:hypothetical protein
MAYTQLAQPSMALNDTRLDTAFQMWNTRTVRPEDSLANIFDNVVAVAKGAPGGKLKNLVINCHGKPGYLYLGEGMDRVETIIFRALAHGEKPLVETIWILACLIARIDKPGDPVRGDGNVFCSEVAQHAKATVIASTATQKSRRITHPYGLVDEYEGTVLIYNPSGAVAGSYTLPPHSIITSE